MSAGEETLSKLGFIIVQYIADYEMPAERLPIEKEFEESNISLKRLTGVMYPDAVKAIKEHIESNAKEGKKF